MRRRARVLAACGFTLCGAFLVGDAAAQGAQVLVIRGGTLIDGLGGPPVANAMIVVRGDRIAAVGRAGAVQVPAGAKTIDADGKYIIPGLIDAKSNYYWEYGEANLVWGVTSVMVSGARNDVGIAERDAIAHGIFAGPRLYQTEVSIAGPGADNKKNGDFRPGMGTQIFHSPEQVRKAVSDYIADGADFITFNDGNAPPSYYAQGVEEAHREGKAVAFRAVGPITRAREAASIGADVLIHSGNVEDEMLKPGVAPPQGFGRGGWADVDPAKEPAMLKFLLAHHTALEPELISNGGRFAKSAAKIREEVLRLYDDPSLRAYMPAYRIRQMFAKVRPPAETMTPAERAKSARGFRNYADFLGRYVKAGGHVLVATDCPQGAPGLGLHQEMEMFQEDVGMKPMQIIQAATKWTADAFRIADIGSIAPGKFADMDILDADPLKDINNTRKLDTVIQGGKVIDRTYHAWYRSPFGKSTPNAGNPVIPHPEWTAALKQTTAHRRRRGNGRGVPDPVTSPTPAIESLFPYEVQQGSAETILTITGFGFTKRSVAYVDHIPVPTRVVSGTEIAATVSANILARAGRFEVVVKNPAPLAEPIWGDTSNVANLLVPFAFTTKYSHNTL